MARIAASWRGYCLSAEEDLGNQGRERVPGVLSPHNATLFRFAMGLGSRGGVSPTQVGGDPRLLNTGRGSRIDPHKKSRLNWGSIFYVRYVRIVYLSS